MMFRTHLVFAFLVGLIFLELSRGNKYLFLAIILISGVIVDIDYPKSKVGRKFFFISKPVNFLFGHRSLFHSLFFVLILSFFVFLIFGDYYKAVFIGYSSHLFLDSFTRQGIMLFYPFKFKVKGVIKTGKLFEGILFFVFIFLSLVKLISL